MSNILQRADWGRPSAGCMAIVLCFSLMFCGALLCGPAFVRDRPVGISPLPEIRLQRPAHRVDSGRGRLFAAFFLELFVH